MRNLDILKTPKLLVTLLCLLGTTAYSQIEFVDIDCNRVVKDSTIDRTSDLSSIDYTNCYVGDSVYDAGDQLYKFHLLDTTTVDVMLTNLTAGVELDVFLMANALDTAGVDSTAACLATSIDGAITALKLDPGTYWLAVDGASADVDDKVEGHYELVVKCDFAYEIIECGQILSGTTVDKLSSFEALDIGSTCVPSGSMYDAGDHLYRFDLVTSQTVEFKLQKFDNMDLHLFIFQTVQDGEGGFMLGSCSWASATGGTTESVTINLTLPGAFWILVDGDQVDDVGSYELSVRCQYDYEELDQNELTAGTTINRVDYESSYNSCTGENYSSGDKTYTFTVTEADTFRFLLDMLTEGEDLDLFLMSSKTQGGVLVPDTCMAISDTSTVREVIGQRLEPGLYFVVVDGIFDSGNENEADYQIIAQQGMGFPVELISFSADIIEEGVGLRWETASEIDFEGFRVQKSFEGGNWVDLGWVESKGSPTGAAYYEYVDKAAAYGPNLYRLESIDVDGSIQYSNVISVSVYRMVDDVSVFPTLVTDQVTIAGSVDNVPVRYEMFNAYGQLMREGVLSTAMSEVPVTGLASGVFYLNVTLANGGQSIFRLIRN